MRKNSTLLLIAMIFTTIASVVLSCNNSPVNDENKKDITKGRENEKGDMIARGAYLVNLGGCNDCHSPKKFTADGPEVDSTKMLSGHPANFPLPPFDTSALKPGYWIQMGPDLTAFGGPWGISFGANLTPDSATGIGAWTEDVFIKAIRTGKHLGQASGRPILPPMPWPAIAKMTDDDLKAVYAYLRSLPPVNNRVPAPLSPEEAAKLGKK